MKVTYLNINNLQEVQPIEKWLLSFPMSIQKEILKYKQAKDQWRVLGGKLLLKTALEERKISFSLEYLQATKKGKPYFKNVDFDFNISHSGEFVAIAFSENGRCGIDVEMHRKVDVEIFERNFTEKEWKEITNANDTSKQFFDYWAIKESIIKADGRGIEVLGKSAIINTSKAICDGKEYFIVPFYIAKGYSCCVASEKAIPILNIEKLGFNNP